MTGNAARRMSRLHRWVAASDYTWPHFLAFTAIRLVQIAGMLWVLVWIIRWGFLGA